MPEPKAEDGGRRLPKRAGLEKVLIIGSGPIVIGQGCEFDYSGTQACKALREEGIKIGLAVPRSGIARTLDEARRVVDLVGLPAIVRASFTLAGTGSGIAWNREEFEELAARGLEASPIREILVEESVLGWKEYELEL